MVSETVSRLLSRRSDIRGGMATRESKRATRWTDAKLAAFKLPDGIAEQRVLVAPGLYLHGRRKADGTAAKHWQYRAQVDGVRRWLSLGA